MNLEEKTMMNLLSEMKDKYGVVSVKSEFESEGASFEEVKNLKNIASAANLDLTVKIGGCEAINDLYELKAIGVNAIVAPMIESVYAFKKYISACKSVFSDIERSKINFFINIETVCGYKYLEEILNSEFSKMLSGVVFGRSDMAGSLGLKKEDINSDLIFDYAKEISLKVKESSKEFILGGAINQHSMTFFNKLPNLDKFETRKIIFDAQNSFAEKNTEEGLLKAFEFELLWLKNKRLSQGIVRNDDIQRIKMLEDNIHVITK